MSSNVTVPSLDDVGCTADGTISLFAKSGESHDGSRIGDFVRGGDLREHTSIQMFAGYSTCVPAGRTKEDIQGLGCRITRLLRFRRTHGMTQMRTFFLLLRRE